MSSITAAARRSVLSLARLRHVPITAAAIITAADVPLATTGSMPNSRIIAGTHDHSTTHAEQAVEDAPATSPMIHVATPPPRAGRQPPLPVGVGGGEEQAKC